MQTVMAEDRPNVGLTVMVLKTADQKSRIMRVVARRAIQRCGTIITTPILFRTVPLLRADIIFGKDTASTFLYGEYFI